MVVEPVVMKKAKKKIGTNPYILFFAIVMKIVDVGITGIGYLVISK